ncbi:MAG: glycosyltransferase family 2 protein [Oscillospiraceae bacterium]|nr:glycosyltransferase family 2 protein [Oscillospiraceae bacterium]
MKLIIQIPCFNEEESLPVTYADLPRQLDGIDCLEYLIINDGSADRTVEVARELGIHHIVSFKQNKGLARAFSAGLDTCLRLGADIVVNTDADNQYNGADIARLIEPILANKADMVIGERPIADTEHFSASKKKFQNLGSFVVRVASGTKVADAPSGFRAYSREAILRMNVINEYTYTLESIIQAGHNKMSIASVPIRTNADLRPSRLFKSPWKYMKRSAPIIVRSFMMYKPLKFFTILGVIFTIAALAIFGRFFFFWLTGGGAGHIQSLLFSVLFFVLGFLCVLAGLQADLTSASRKILEDVQYRVRRLEAKIAETNEQE